MTGEDIQVELRLDLREHFEVKQYKSYELRVRYIDRELKRVLGITLDRLGAKVDKDFWTKCAEVLTNNFRGAALDKCYD